MMLIAVLLAVVAVVAGYFVHQKLNGGGGKESAPKAEGSKREKLASKRESKRELLDSKRSQYNTAADSSVRTVADGVETNNNDNLPGLEGAAPVPRDESSRDVKTARSPLPADLDALNNNNNNTGDAVQLVKDAADGGAPEAGSPSTKTAVIPTASEILRGNLGNLPDSTAQNVSPASASNREVKADPATATALTETKSAKVKATKKRSSDGKKSPKKKAAKRSKSLKSSDGTSD